jgi:hypothetical protein
MFGKCNLHQKPACKTFRWVWGISDLDLPAQTVFVWTWAGFWQFSQSEVLTPKLWERGRSTAWHTFSELPATTTCWKPPVRDHPEEMYVSREVLHNTVHPSSTQLEHNIDYGSWLFHCAKQSVYFHKVTGGIRVYQHNGYNSTAARQDPTTGIQDHNKPCVIEDFATNAWSRTLISANHARNYCLIST